MNATLRHGDPAAHEPGCLHNSADLPLADPGDVYVDVFCDCHRYTEPKILSNGSDIAWPAGWDQDQARTWRRQNGLAAPPGLEVV
jgi:hypothetical protein